jgi:hypothetical protein
LRRPPSVATSFVTSSYLTANYNTKTVASSLFLPFVGGRISSGGVAQTQVGNQTYTMEATHSTTGVYNITFPSYGSTTYTVVCTSTTSSGNPTVCCWSGPTATGLAFRITTLAGTLIDRDLYFVIF